MKIDCILEIEAKMIQERWLSPTKRAPAAKIN